MAHLILKESFMDYETLMLSRDALTMMLELPNLPQEDRMRAELAISTIDLNKTLEEQSKRRLARDKRGELIEPWF